MSSEYFSREQVLLPENEDLTGLYLWTTIVNDYLTLQLPKSV